MSLIQSDEQFNQALAAYNSIFPLKEINHKALELNKADIFQRPKIWESFDLPVVALSQAFRDLIVARNNFQKTQGHTDQLQASLANHQIPESSFSTFEKKLDTLINFCQENLPADIRLPDYSYSEFYQPCFLCQLPDFPFKSLPDARSWLVLRLPDVANHQDKLHHITSDSSYTERHPGEGHITISINKNQNIRHQTLDLIHEYSHVSDRLSHPQTSGKFHVEKAAYTIMFPLIKKLAPEIFRAYLAEVLLLIRKNLFELTMYRNPNDNPSRVYAETFNCCFPQARQDTNNTYLLNDDFVMKPFRSLPHIIAQSELLLS